MNKALFLVLVLATFLRFWQLAHVPPSTSNDEASIGYNAYSVLQTGADEYGSFPLISQRAYDDWRRSTYLLMVVPFVSLFGLQSLSIRLPSVILAILTVLSTYHIVLSLFRKHSPLAEQTAIGSAFFLAISPWHIYISRIGHETNAYLSFFVFGLLFFLKGLHAWKKMLLSVGCFMVSMISYYAGQVIVPLTTIGLLVVYRAHIIALAATNRKFWFGALLVALGLIPILWAIFSPAAMIRFRATSTFDPSAHEREFRELVLKYNEAVANRNIVGVLFYNRRLFPIRVFVQGYLSHFHPTWLVSNSGKESFKIPHTGLLYPFQLLLIAIGIVAFTLNNEIRAQEKKLMFLWLVLAALPASVATQAPHAMRAYVLAPVLAIFSSLGLVYVLSAANTLRTVLMIFFIVLVLFSLRALYVNYFIVFPREQSQSFYYAISKAIPYAIAQESRYDTVVFSNQNHLYQSYMAFLYYSRYDPSLYQKQGGTISGGFAESHVIGKFQFRPIDWGNEKPNGNTLFIGNAEDFPEGAAIATFPSLDGEPTVYAAVR
jgi:4-amino-4-deoxy-L-arabinose transferase-like glycosyltransferase